MTTISVDRFSVDKIWYLDCQCWCICRFGACSDKWTSSVVADKLDFVFKNDADATMFALRWV